MYLSSFLTASVCLHQLLSNWIVRSVNRNCSHYMYLVPFTMGRQTSCCLCCNVNRKKLIIVMDRFLSLLVVYVMLICLFWTYFRHMSPVLEVICLHGLLPFSSKTCNTRHKTFLLRWFWCNFTVLGHLDFVCPS